MNTIHKSVTIKAPAAKVWDSLTNPELIKLWMTDSAIEIVSNWQEGSPIVFRGDLHGINFENKGTILQFEPGKKLSYTFWSSLTEHADLPENYSVISFVLQGEEHQTALSFTQNNLMTDAQYRHVNFYWGVALELIRLLNEDKGRIE